MIFALGMLCVLDATSNLILAFYAAPRIGVATWGQYAASVFGIGLVALHINSAVLYFNGTAHTARPAFLVFRAMIAAGALVFSLAIRRSVERAS